MRDFLNVCLYSCPICRVLCPSMGAGIDTSLFSPIVVADGCTQRALLCQGSQTGRNPEICLCAWSVARPKPRPLFSRTCLATSVILITLIKCQHDYGRFVVYGVRLSKPSISLCGRVVIYRIQRVHARIADEDRQTEGLGPDQTDQRKDMSKILVGQQTCSAREKAPHGKRNCREYAGISAKMTYGYHRGHTPAIIILLKLNYKRALGPTLCWVGCSDGLPTPTLTCLWSLAFLGTNRPKTLSAKTS